MVAPGRPPRLVVALVAGALGATAAAVLASVWAFGQTRFLTIDEFQWGHATWLVAQGRIPYLDFYEHHLPVGYALHAPLLDEADGFEANTRRLRHVAFAYMLAALGALAAATWRTTRSLPEALLIPCVVPAIGFGLMSAIDYRGDNWAAFTLIGSLAAIELGHTTRAAWPAALAGVLFALAIGMTQKVLLLGGGAVALAVAASLSLPPETARRVLGAIRVERPWAFVAGAGAVAVGLLGAGLALGMLGAAWEINVVHALAHERLYPGFSVRQFLDPYLAETATSSLALAAGAAIHLAGGRRSFWAWPTLAALVGVAFVRAPFPYNHVLVCWLLGVCAVRGFGRAIRFVGERARPDSPLAAAWPLLYLLPLATVPQQLGFVSGTSTLDDQLRLLAQVERYSGPEDVVLDDAGSALFRPDRGYHWYHGRAHVRMFADWFEGDLVAAMRASRAPLWIRTVRADLLPAPAARYLQTHYVPLHGDLHVLGFVTRATGADERRVGRIDVVRGGRYWVTPVDAATPGGADGPPGPILVAGRPVEGDSVVLDAGRHAVEIPPGTPALRFSYLPPEAFGPPTQPRPHTPLFEFRRARRPGGRTSS